MAVGDGTRIEWHEAELAAVAHAEYVRARLAGFGGQIGAAAKATAPRAAVHRGPPSGHGADSIHAKTVLEDGEWTVRVAWDQLHAYMRHPEFGTKYQPAQHFLLHAADRYARP
jgi:HK97 gp10 family phage protein